MKAIMISIKPKWCAKIMTGDKTIEVRKNKALATAIQKLINEYGYADIYVYCSKDKKEHLVIDIDNCVGINPVPYCYGDEELNGKVIFKFRCYKVEEIKFTEYQWIGTKETPSLQVLDKSCLSAEEITTYLKSKNGYGYAIHIIDLEIFDMPKELRSFNKFGSKEKHEKALKYAMKEDCKISERIHNGVARDNEIANCVELEEASYYMGAYGLTKAPQNYCYVEI